MDLAWLKSVAPTVATALAGPLAGLAVQAVGSALGMPVASREAVLQQLQGGQLSAEQLLQLRQADTELQQRERELGLRFAEIEAADRTGAREREIRAGDTATPRWLAVVVILGWLVVQGVLLWHEVPAGMREIVMRGLGTLDMALGMVLAYYYGTSAGSAAKNALLARPTPAGGERG